MSKATQEGINKVFVRAFIPCTQYKWIEGKDKGRDAWTERFREGTREVSAKKEWDLFFFCTCFPGGQPVDDDVMTTSHEPVDSCTVIFLLLYAMVWGQILGQWIWNGFFSPMFVFCVKQCYLLWITFSMGSHHTYLSLLFYCLWFLFSFSFSF